MEVGHTPSWMSTNLISGHESPHGKAKLRPGHQLGGSHQEDGGLGGSQYHILGGSVHLPSHIQSVVHHLIGKENGSTPEVTSPKSSLLSHRTPLSVVYEVSICKGVWSNGISSTSVFHVVGCVEQ